MEMIKDNANFTNFDAAGYDSNSLLPTTELDIENTNLSFLKTLSHELRTPLTGILGTSWLLEQEGLTPAQTEYVNNIQQCSNQLLTVITELLTMLKIKNNIDSKPNFSIISSQKADSDSNSKPEEIDKKFHVLLVEDDKIVQKVHYHFLASYGCTVDIAEDGFQAVEKAKNNYDLILMDIGLPSMSGIEATTKIRENDKKVPIVGLTGFIQDKIKQDCLAVGMNEVATKPIKMENLKDLVQRLLA